ncbi:SDR family NAD(P)-dependent oxidoreductase [Novosphingobium sp.]|uniref:SDR family NAD(P)-dependent oxidoreductase n=1 Tax=Novosphingobium sp. TaxID=1874826 RepID=UPI0038BDDB44
MDFTGAHVLVTGASTGIGLATAQRLAGYGAHVSLVARNASKLAEAVVTIEAAGGKAHAFAADVGDPAAFDAAVDAAEAIYGRVTHAFANAGTGGTFGPLVDCPDDVFEAVMRTNVTAVFRLLRRVLPGMIAARQGSVLVTGSLASERGLPMNPAYVASKHAVLGLARAAAVEAAPHNVRVNCLLPGFIETPMLHQLGDDPANIAARMGATVPMGRIGSADEAASVAAFLLSDLAAHVTAQAVAVDGGLLGTMIPR